MPSRYRPPVSVCSRRTLATVRFAFILRASRHACDSPARCRVAHSPTHRQSGYGRLPCALQPLGRAFPVLRRVLGWPAFPSAPALGSTGSDPDRSASFVCFAAAMAGPDFSCPFIVGYGSSPSRRDPAARAPRMDKRSPGFRAGSLSTSQGLKTTPGRTVLALLRRSAGTSSAPGMRKLSRLNGWPMPPPADASPPTSRSTAHGSGPVRCA